METRGKIHEVFCMLNCPVRFAVLKLKTYLCLDCIGDLRAESCTIFNLDQAGPDLLHHKMRWKLIILTEPNNAHRNYVYPL